LFELKIKSNNSCWHRNPSDPYLDSESLALNFHCTGVFTFITVVDEKMIKNEKIKSNYIETAVFKH